MTEEGGMNERYLIALGGLLHDIGKFVQRARDRGFSFDSEELSKINEALKGWDSNQKDIFDKEHAYLSKVFLDALETLGIIKADDKKALTEWAVRHHNPTSELQSVISQVADWYSASERENVMGSCINLLHSVFERISLKPIQVRLEEKRELEQWNVKPELSCEELIKEVEEAPLHSTKNFGYYKLSPLSMKSEIFPELFEGVMYVKKKKNREGKEEYDYLIVPRKQYIEKAKAEENGYKKLFDDFWKEVSQLAEVNLSEEQFFNFIYYLLYKYTWCVPASTYDTERTSKHYPDISLFDHSRVLSAIAVSLYDWAMANNKTVEDIKPRKVKDKVGKYVWELPTDEERVFLLVEGDIGGIQSFIYNIHKSSESELSIAKALRGRSFFLTMLPEVIARYILKELDYPITNALYIGGGKFQLLIANTDKNVEKLTQIEEEVNRWMHDEFQGELSLSVAYVPMKGSALREREVKSKDENGEPKTYLDHIEWLQLKLDKKKKRKFGELLFEEFDKDATEADEICPSCRTLYKEKNHKLCHWCNMSQKWGEILPKVKYIAFDWGTNLGIFVGDLGKVKTMCFGKFGKVYLLEESDLKEVNGLPEILNIEDTEFTLEKDKVVNGFKFIGHSAPKVEDEEDEELIKYLNKLWEEKQKNKKENEIQKLEAYHILPFELLVEFAQGDKKLGFFRADVDFLGLILSDGLRFNEFGNEEIYTISRVATLSRMLDLFFAGYLNKLCEEVSREYVKKALEEYKDKELTPVEEKRKKLLEKIYNNGNLKVGSLIYTVYSGGDDLFVIAPYDLATEFALRLRKEFRKFTCNNPDFGISGGIFIGRHNTPIHLVAKFAEHLEDKAKNARKEKDAVAVFEKAFVWQSGDEEKGISFCFKKDESLEEHESNKQVFMSFEDVIKLAELFEEPLKTGGLKRAILYKLLGLYKHYYDPNSDRIHLMIYPKIYYYLGRNVNDGDVRNKLAKALLEGMRDLKEGEAYNPSLVLKNLNVPVSFALMKTRKGGE